MDTVIIMLFYANLLIPFGFTIGLLTWIIGAFAKGSNEQPHPAQHVGKKIMLYSIITFAIGLGSCWGLIGVESLVSEFF